jgi:hypothetical protein
VKRSALHTCSCNHPRLLHHLTRAIRFDDGSPSPKIRQKFSGQHQRVVSVRGTVRSNQAGSCSAMCSRNRVVVSALTLHVSQPGTTMPRPPFATERTTSLTEVEGVDCMYPNSPCTRLGAQFRKGPLAEERLARPTSCSAIPHVSMRTVSPVRHMQLDS